jgi:hypothetical protein
MLLTQIGVNDMATFDPKLLVPASKSREFNGSAVVKSPKSILVAAIDKQIGLYKKPSEEGRRWFTLGDKEVAIRLKFANKAIPLAGDEDIVVVPRDQFEAAMLYYKGEVEKGVFDKPLEELAKGREARTSKMRETRAAKKAAKEKGDDKAEVPKS